jgi:hypothetical protein
MPKSLVNDIAENFINGNITDAMALLANCDTFRAAYVALCVVELLPKAERMSFVRAIERRIG